VVDDTVFDKTAFDDTASDGRRSTDFLVDEVFWAASRSSRRDENWGVAGTSGAGAGWFASWFARSSANGSGVSSSDTGVYLRASKNRVLAGNFPRGSGSGSLSRVRQLIRSVTVRIRIGNETPRQGALNAPVSRLPRRFSLRTAPQVLAGQAPSNKLAI
jgi:hypothetical protein